jgi:hypothetical protein
LLAIIHKIAAARQTVTAPHQALTRRFDTSALSHSRSFDQRRRPETLRTAMATDKPLPKAKQEAVYDELVRIALGN